METANVGAYVIGSIRAHTNLHLCRRPHGRHPTRLVWTGRRLSARTRHCSQITHTKPHTSSLEAVTPAYGDLCQVGCFFFFLLFFFQNRSSDSVCPRSLKEDQAEHDVVGSTQMQRWGNRHAIQDDQLQVRGHTIPTLYLQMMKTEPEKSI